jgi:hypothetical protein
MTLVLLLIALLATMAVVSNPAFAAASRLFKNKSECIEYVIDGTHVVRNHALQKAKVSKELVEKLCAVYGFRYRFTYHSFCFLERLNHLLCNWQKF